MRTILFPTKFSAEAQDRLKSACRLAHANGARIIVLTSIPVPDPYIYPTADMLNSSLEEAFREKEKAFFDLRSEVQAAFADNVQIDLEILIGNPENSVFLAAKKYKPQVVLMGGEVYGKVNSITEKIIQKLSCPVLALPAHVQLEKSPKLVYATNFRKEDRRIINKLLHFAEIFSGSLHCIHIKQDRSKIDYSKVLPWRQQYQQEIEAGLISFEVIYQHEVHKQLDLAWHKHQPGLWVLPVTRSNWLGKLFPSSSPSLDVSPSRSPVLALNRK